MYLNKQQLSLLVGQELIFETWNGLKKGTLHKDGNKYWLPFCGFVNAETVKIAEIDELYVLPKREFFNWPVGIFRNGDCFWAEKSLDEFIAQGYVITTKEGFYEKVKKFDYIFTTLHKNVKRIKDINTYYGTLCISNMGGRYFWSIDSHDMSDWYEIDKNLYENLLKYTV